MPYSKGDLHLQTNNSDGKYTLSELKKKIYESGGNKVISITDHQYMTEKKAYTENNILWIPGIEISAVANGVPVHITAYGVEPVSSEELKNMIKKIVDEYDTRAKKIHERRISLGYDVPPLSAFRDPTLPSPIYKSDMVVQLGKIIGIEDEKEIRKWAREHGNLFFVEEENFMPDVSELIPALHDSKMIACRAHPGKNLFRDLKETEEGLKILDYIASSGIDGIEAFSHKQTPDQSNLITSEAKKRNLLITGGSDYHGEDGHTIEYPLDETMVGKFLEAIGWRE